MSADICNQSLTTPVSRTSPGSLTSCASATADPVPEEALSYLAVMSSESREEVVSQALEAGASEYLVKPIRRRELSNLWQRVNQPAQGTGGSFGQLSAAVVFSCSVAADAAGPFLISLACHTAGS